MKIETPQILWHNGCQNDNGKNAPLLSCSMLESGWRDDKDIPSRKEEGSYGHVLATSSNTSEVHLWKVVFQCYGENKDVDGSGAVATTTTTTTCNNNTPKMSQPPSPFSSPTQHRIEHLLTLARHERSVNATAFSPNGIHLVTAGDNGSVIVWSVPPSKRGNNNGRHFWGSLSSMSTEKDLDCRVLNHPCDDVMDICWSKDSKRFVLCSLDHCVLVYEDLNYGLRGEESKWSCVMRNAKDHLSYVQGVAYDPLGVYVASQGSDRTVRIFSRKTYLPKKKGTASVKITAGAAEETAEQRLLREQAQTQQKLTEKKFEVVGKTKVLKYRSTAHPSTEPFASPQSCKIENNGMFVDSSNNSKLTTRHHLFADESTVESFFRRLAWTTDGAFLIAPAALYHANDDKKPDAYNGDNKDKEEEAVTPTSMTDVMSSTTSSTPTFATYLFARHHFDKPFKVFAGLEKPSVVVRPNPILFTIPKTPTTTKTPHMQPYRSIFAVLTLDCILLYDTYHDAPLAMAQGLHYSGLTDCSWSNDGRHLIVTSTDGYITILSFETGELGEVYSPPPSPTNASSLSSFSPTTGIINNQDAKGTVDGSDAGSLVDEPSLKYQLSEQDEEATLLVASCPQQEKSQYAHLKAKEGASVLKTKKRITPILVATEPASSRYDSSEFQNESNKSELIVSPPIIVSECTDEEKEKGRDKPLFPCSAKRNVSQMASTNKDTDKAYSSSNGTGSSSLLSNQIQHDTEVPEDERISSATVPDTESKQQMIQPKKKKKRIQPMLVSCK